MIIRKILIATNLIFDSILNLSTGQIFLENVTLYSRYDFTQNSRTFIIFLKIPQFTLIKYCILLIYSLILII